MAAYYTGKSAYHGEVANRYDEDRQREPIWEVEQRFVRDWVQSLDAGTSVLDVPCGTGRFVPCMLERRLKVHARDISADMVAEILRRYPAAAVDAAVGDAEQLEFADNSVDVLISWRFFHLLPEAVLLPVLQEFRRVTRGSIMIEVLQVSRTHRRGWLKAMVDRFRPWYHRLRPVRGEQPWSHITSYSHSEATLERLFHAAGLSVAARHELGVSAQHPVIVYQLHKAGP